MFPLTTTHNAPMHRATPNWFFLDFCVSTKINFSSFVGRKAQPGKAKRVEITNDLMWAGAQSERLVLSRLNEAIYMIGKFNAN